MLPGLTCALLAYTPGATGGSMVATISPSSVSRTTGTKTGPKAVTSPSVTAAGSGGVPPYTYAWQNWGGDPDIAALTPAAAMTAFGANLDPDTSRSAIFRVTVTDATGNKAFAEVPVDLHLVDTSGFGGTA